MVSGESMSGAKDSWFGKASQFFRFKPGLVFGLFAIAGRGQGGASTVEIPSWQRAFHGHLYQHKWISWDV